MKISLVSLDKSGFVQIACEGDITTRDFLDMNRNPLDATLGASWPTMNVLMSMAKVTFVDSSAVGWLISCHKEAKKQGGQFVVHSLPPNVLQILDLLHLRTVLRVASSEEEGHAMITAQPDAAGEAKTPAP